MLGYKPFFKEYTTDWDFAVAKMKGSYFQKHLVQEAYGKEKAWDEQVLLSSGDKPTNAEFEQWTTDLSGQETLSNGDMGAGDGAHALEQGINGKLKSG